MATLLHLTDLHLDTPADFSGADFKSDIVPLGDRPDRFGALQTTLQAVAGSQWALDALIVTGDIPYQNGRDTKGWEQFDTAFDPLRDAGKLPPPDKIVVTPGNHDVAWRKPVGDPGHYSEFIAHVRDKGYVTPMLDGIDFNADGQITSAGQHHLLDLDLGLVVVPINSSHYCGALEPMGPALSDDQWEEALVKLRGVDDELASKASEQIVSLRAQDIARISEPQFKALTELVANIKRAIPKDHDPRRLVWVAALHHHLLPVSTDEEFKSYESMTNLGRFRQLLIDLGFHVVAHGHKHSGGVFWDRVHRKGASLQDPDPRLLVVSGSTAGSRREGTEETARLIEIEPSTVRRAVVVSKVPLLDHGARLPDPLLSERADLWAADMALEPGFPRSINGPTASRVYERVQALFASLPDDQTVSHLVCEVQSAHDAQKPPIGYPVDRIPGGADEAEKWFDQMVAWWQRDESKFQFTHGQRLRAWGKDRINQVAEATRLLQNNARSSRAVITLIDPSTDRLADEAALFPAFSFAHLLIRDAPNEPRRLDCVGFFRKQEMRFWWPINVAELARLQLQVCERLDQPDLRLGSIITYATIAHVGSEVPAVNVTAIDRLADGQEDDLWKLAYGIVHPESVDAATVKQDWLRILTDLHPVAGERFPVPHLGVQLLLRFIERFDRHASDQELNTICERIRRLEHDYIAVAADQWDPEYQRERISESLEALRGHIESRFPSDPATTMNQPTITN